MPVLPLFSKSSNKPRSLNTKPSPVPNGVWLLCLVLLTLAYLVVEVIFNTSLVVVTSSGYDQEATEKLELFGRTVSGVGFVLLFLGWLASRGSLGQLKNVAIAAPFALVLWFIVFAGQKWVVDHFLVDPSSAQARQQAAVSQIFKGAVSAQVLKVKGGQAFLGDLEEDPAQKVYFSLLSGMSFFDKALLNNLGKGVDAVIEYHVNQELDPESDRQFALYKTKMIEFVDRFNSYQKSQKKGDQSVNKAIDTRDEEYLQALSLARESFSNYQREEAAYYRLVDSSPNTSQISNLRRALDQYAKAEKANKQDRMARIVASYNKEFSAASIQLGTFTPPLTYWYEDLQEGALTAGVSVLLGALSGDPGSALIGGVARMVGSREISTDPMYYRRKLREHLGGDPFKNKSGYDSNIRSFEAFAAHPKVVAESVARAKKSNLQVRSNWQVTDRLEFMRAYDERIIKKRSKNIQETTRVGSCNVPLGLSSDDFYRNPCVQEEIRRKMGASSSVVVLPGWSQVTFDSKFMSAKRSEARLEMRRLLKAEGLEFADGGKYAEEGKNALRATLIPPISMGLSLFLILLSVSGLPGKVLLGIRAIRHSQIASTSTGATPNFRAPRTGLFTVVCVVLIVTAPFVVINNRFSDSGADVKDFYGDIRAEVGAPVALSLDWTLRTQPLIQPAGEYLEARLGIRDWFDEHNGLISAFDEKLFSPPSAPLFGIHPAPKRIKGDFKVPNAAGTPLYILAGKGMPSNARVQILNIAPVYRDGMVLKPGKYDVLIRSDGYSQIRQTVVLSPQEYVFEFVLAPSKTR